MVSDGNGAREAAFTCSGLAMTPLLGCLRSATRPKRGVYGGGNAVGSLSMIGPPTASHGVRGAFTMTRFNCSPIVRATARGCPSTTGAAVPEADVRTREITTRTAAAMMIMSVGITAAGIIAMQAIMRRAFDCLAG